MDTQLDFSSLFDEPSRAVDLSQVKAIYEGSTVYASVHCIVCDERCNVSIDEVARLCSGCKQDPLQCRTTLEQRRIATEEKVVSLNLFFRALVNRESTTDQERYQRILDARLLYVGSQHETALRMQEEKARQRNDGLSRILYAEERYYKDLDTLQAHLHQLTLRIEELSALDIINQWSMPAQLYARLMALEEQRSKLNAA